MKYESVCWGEQAAETQRCGLPTSQKMCCELANRVTNIVDPSTAGAFRRRRHYTITVQL